MSLKQDGCRELCSPKVLDNVKPAWLLAFISALPTVVTLEDLKTQNPIAPVLEPVLSGNLCQISDTCISLLAWEMEQWKMCLHTQPTLSLQEHYMALVNWVLCRATQGSKGHDDTVSLNAFLKVAMYMML